MKLKQIRYITLIGAVAIIGIVAIQVNWLFTTWEMNKEKLDYKLWMALKDISQTINTYHDCVPSDLNPVSKIEESCYIIDVGCEFNQSNLTHVIKTIFNKQNLNIPYYLSAYNCNTNQTEFIGLFANSELENLSEKNEDDCLETLNTDFVYYFVIHFPNTNAYLFKQIQLWIVFSLIVLIILIFFTYTILLFYSQKQLTELQKDFINNMTHELKTPISSIAISSDVLNEYKDQIPERFYQYVQVIKTENKRLNHLVESVLQSAKMDRKKSVLNKERIDLLALLYEVIHLNSIIKNRAEITIEPLANETNAWILADKLHLTNLLFNLLDNAIKYSNQNASIKIEIIPIKQHYKLSISDNGIGIPDKYTKKVFKKFFRVPTGDMHNVKGFGLGLFYVKTVCDSHGWNINIDSTIDKGTRIHILMPKAV